MVTSFIKSNVEIVHVILLLPTTPEYRGRNVVRKEKDKEGVRYTTTTLVVIHQSE